LILLGTGFQSAGKASRVVVGRSPLTCASFEAAWKVDDYPTTNFESFDVALGQSFGEGIDGPLDADIKFGGDWDMGTNPLDVDAPPGLYPRDDLENLQFVISQLFAPLWDFPIARIRSATNGGDVKGKVTFQCGGMNQGLFFFPSGSVVVV